MSRVVERFEGYKNRVTTHISMLPSIFVGLLSTKFFDGNASLLRNSRISPSDSDTEVLVKNKPSCG